jgi:hypothetical protein
MSPRSEAERSSHSILTKGEDVCLEEKGVGLEKPMIRLSFRADGEMNTCHFEPKARNLKFLFPPAL